MVVKVGMDIGKLEVLVKAAELGNLTRAAEALGYTQSAVSRIIADLEQEWGLPVLIRGRGGVSPTAAGRELLPAVQAVCNAQRALEQEVAEIHGLARGTIRIGAFTSIAAQWLPPIMKTFLRSYPGIRFEILTHIEYREIEEWISAGTVDCGFAALPTTLPLDTVFLRRDAELAVLPPDHPLAGAERYPVERFAEDPYIKMEDNRDREVLRIFEALGVRPNLCYNVNDDYSVMSMVENGLGVSVLPDLILRRNPYAIVTKPLDPPQYRYIGLAVRRLDSLSPLTARFVAHVQAWVAGDAI